MVIIDTGPLVALFDQTEPAHERCKAALKKLNTIPLTTWPVITEAFSLLGGWEKGQNKLWDFIMAGGLSIHEVPAAGYGRLRELMKKYADNPMDLADATVVLLAEIHSIRIVFTLDKRDFTRYRPKHCAHFDVIP
jgi:predicted nucleic acid-binding protein